MKLVDGVIHNLCWKGMGITEVNRLLYAGGVVVAMRLGMKVGKVERREKKKPRWQRRIEKSIVMWSGHLSQVEEIRKGKKVREKVWKELDRRYGLTERDAVSVSTFLKNKIKAGSTKIRWFEEKNGARRQNYLFRNNQRQLYKELSGDTAQGNASEIPDAAESREFWKGIWSVEKEHDREASWLGEIREEMSRIQTMDDVVVDIEGVKKGIRKMTNWKAPGPDMVRGFWFKKLTSLHLVLTDALKGLVMSGEVPDWMVKGRTVLIQKDPAKGKVAKNYRPIACLPLMWKLLTGIFADKVYDHLHVNSLLPDEQKGCRRQSRGTKDQLLIDREVLRDAKRKKRHLSMAWIDYQKAYDMLPHSWILETLGLIKVAKNIESLLTKSMSKWRTVLTAGGEVLGEVNIKSGIFQGDTLSPLLFVVAMIPLSLILRKEDMGYRWGEHGRKINHLLFMDDLKLFGKDMEEVEKLCQTVHKFSQDIGMKFGLDKCAVLELKNGVRERCDGVVLPDGGMMQDVDENGYKYLGVLEAGGMMVKEMKEKVRKEYVRRVRAVAGSGLTGGNLVGAVNAWAVSVIRYTAGILDWTNAELKALDVKTRKLLRMNGAFHFGSSVVRLYMKRKVGGRGMISVEQCVRSEERGLNEYVMASEEWMLKVVAAGMEEMEPQLEYKKRMADERDARLREMLVHGKFFKETEDVADEKSWQWMKDCSLKKWTEGYVCAAQENVLRTRYYSRSVLKADCEPNCRLCGYDVETVGHLVSACSKLAQTEYKRRHDHMGLRIYWELCGKYGLKRSEYWWEEVPDAVRLREDGKVEIWWDRKVHVPDGRIVENRPDVVVVDRECKQWWFVEFAVPFDGNVARKEVEKEDKYRQLAAEIARMHGVKVVTVPIVIGALGVVAAGFVDRLQVLGLRDVVGELQTSVLISTTAILRRVLSGGFG